MYGINDMKMDMKPEKISNYLAEEIIRTSYIFNTENNQVNVKKNDLDICWIVHQIKRKEPVTDN